MHVLFVCTGNICRSPTAERLAAAHASAQQISGFTASSAGTRAVIGHPIHASAAEVLERLGGDSSNFAATQLTSKVATAADLIVTMTRDHRDAVLELAPNKLHRAYTLAEISTLASRFHARNLADLANLRPQLIPGEVPDIVDPIGQNSSIFEAIGHHIADLLPPVLELCRPE